MTLGALRTGAGGFGGTWRHRALRSKATRSQTAGIQHGALEVGMTLGALRTGAGGFGGTWRHRALRSKATGTGDAGVLLAANVRVPQQPRGTGADRPVSDNAAGGVQSTHLTTGLQAGILTGGLDAGLAAVTLRIVVASI